LSFVSGENIVSLSVSELRVAGSFIRQARVLTDAVRDLFFIAREPDRAARLRDISARLEEEGAQVERLLAKEEGRS
jgi:hypothetical protein